MNKTTFVLLVLGGACAVASASGCVLDADVGAGTGGSGATTGAGAGGCGAGSSSGGGGSAALSGGSGGTGGSTGEGGGTGGEGGSNPMFACGPIFCALDLTYCQITLPGLPGGEAAYQCKPTPAECLPDPTCECVSPHICDEFCGPEGGCGESCAYEVLDGSITGTCALP